MSSVLSKHILEKAFSLFGVAFSIQSNIFLERASQIMFKEKMRVDRQCQLDNALPCALAREVPCGSWLDLPYHRPGGWLGGVPASCGGGYRVLMIRSSRTTRMSREGSVCLDPRIHKIIRDVK